MYSYPDDYRNTVGITIPNENRRVYIQVDYSDCTTNFPFDDDATLRQKLQAIFDNPDEMGEGKRMVVNYAVTAAQRYGVQVMRMYIMSPLVDRTHLHIGGMLFAQGAPPQYFDGLKIPLDVQTVRDYSRSIPVQTGYVYNHWKNMNECEDVYGY